MFSYKKLVYQIDKLLNNEQKVCILKNLNIEHLWFIKYTLLSDLSIPSDIMQIISSYMEEIDIKLIKQQNYIYCATAKFQSKFYLKENYCCCRSIFYNIEKFEFKFKIKHKYYQLIKNKIWFLTEHHTNDIYLIKQILFLFKQILQIQNKNRNKNLKDCLYPYCSIRVCNQIWEMEYAVFPKRLLKNVVNQTNIKTISKSKKPVYWWCNKFTTNYYLLGTCSSEFYFSLEPIFFLKDFIKKNRDYHDRFVKH